MATATRQQTQWQSSFLDWQGGADISTTGALRMNGRADVLSIPGKDDAHWLDLEVVADTMNKLTQAERQTVTVDDMRALRDLLRSKDNLRPLSRARNQDEGLTERVTAAIVNGNVASDGDRTLRGHKLTKVKHQVEFVVKHKNEIPQPILKGLADKLAALRDGEAGGRSVMDRRRLGGAHLPRTTGGTEAAAGPLKQDGTPDMRYKANREAAAKEAAGSSTAPNTPLKKDGTPDMRYKANREAAAREASSGTSTPVNTPLKKDGTPDMRYKANREARNAAASSPTASFQTASSTGPLKKDGTPDMRYKANRAEDGAGTSSPAASSASFYTATSTGPRKKDGTPDMRYRANRAASGAGAATSSPAASFQTASSAGPLKEDGTPDMRYKANKAMYGAATSDTASSAGPSQFSFPVEQQRDYATPQLRRPTRVVSSSAASSSAGAALRAAAPRAAPARASSASLNVSGPLKRDGTPDMRYSVNRTTYAPAAPSHTYTSAAYAPGPLKSDGTPDMRYSANRTAYATPTSSYTSASYAPGPLKMDGTPDMRFSANRAAFGGSRGRR